VTQNSEPLPKSAQATKDNPLSPVIGGPYYTIDEIAAIWKVSRDSVRKIFRRESGVLAFSAPRRPGKRSYTTLRVPQSVLERVHRKLSIVKILTK
jgi:hypothetical protein